MGITDDIANWFSNIAVDRVWVITLLLILIAGLFLIWKIDWPNFKITEAIHIVRNRKKDTKGISTMGSFFVALSARMGAGNIIGVAIAIIVGGPGSILWMWIFSLFGAVLCFAECTLGQIFKEKRSDGLFRGGPAYYTIKGIHSQRIATLFAVLLIIVGLVFAGLQANNMNVSIRESVPLDPAIVALGIAALIGFLIYIGLKRITKVISFIVPMFAVVWVSAVLITIAMRADQIPVAIGNIFNYGLGSGFGSLAGAGFGILVILTGFKRGAFCSEGGTGQISSVSSSADDDHPCVQGYMQAFGVYFDIFFICTMSALLVLTYTSNHQIEYGVEHIKDAIPLIVNSLQLGFIGDFAKPFFTIVLVIITFASICGNYVFSESNTKYLFHNNKKSIIILNILFIAFVFFMSMTEFKVVWAMGDILIGILIIVNIYVIYKLYRYVSLATKDYRKQRREGTVAPKFHAESVLQGLETSEITEWR